MSYNNNIIKKKPVTEHTRVPGAQTHSFVAIDNNTLYGILFYAKNH